MGGLRATELCRENKCVPLAKTVPFVWLEILVIKVAVRELSVSPKHFPVFCK